MLPPGYYANTQAMDAIQQMKDKVDTLIVVANDQLLQVVPENTPLTDAFLVADDILRQGVVGISDIIVKPGLVNVDFADVRTIMGNAGMVVAHVRVCAFVDDTARPVQRHYYDVRLPGQAFSHRLLLTLTQTLTLTLNDTPYPCILHCVLRHGADGHRHGQRQATGGGRCRQCHLVSPIGVPHIPGPGHRLQRGGRARHDPAGDQQVWRSLLWGWDAVMAGSAAPVVTVVCAPELCC